VVEESDPRRIALEDELRRRRSVVRSDRLDIERRIKADDPECAQLREWIADWADIESILATEPMAGVELLSHIASQPQRVGAMDNGEPIYLAKAGRGVTVNSEEAAKL
jgi:hypothetical protein